MYLHVPSSISSVLLNMRGSFLSHLLHQKCQREFCPVVPLSSRSFTLSCLIDLQIAMRGITMISFRLTGEAADIGAESLIINFKMRGINCSFTLLEVYRWHGVSFIQFWRAFVNKFWSLKSTLQFELEILILTLNASTNLLMVIYSRGAK